jgi:hypothetical protein
MSLILPYRKRKLSQGRPEDNAGNIVQPSLSVMPEQRLSIRESLTPRRSPERPRPTVILLVTVMPLSDLDKQSLDCPICYDEYDEYVYIKGPILRHADYPIRLDYTVTGAIRTPLCGHILGRNCLEEYLEASFSSNISNNKCPRCSTPLHFGSHVRPSHWSIIPCDLWILRTHLSLQNFGSQVPPYGFEEMVQMVVDAYGIKDLVKRLKAKFYEVLKTWRDLKQGQMLGPNEEEILDRIRDFLLDVGRLASR